MSEAPTNPMLKRILIAIAGVTILGVVLLYLLATYPAGEYRVADELRARGFKVWYSRRNDTVMQHPADMIWQHPNNVVGTDRSITPDDCRLICQLPRLQGLGFERCDFSESNLDDVGNCRELTSFCCDDVTQLSAVEMEKLAACPVTVIMLRNAHLTDYDLEAFAGLTKLMYLDLEENIEITDAGLEHLEKIASLQFLCLPKTSVTKDGVREFQKKRPDVKVFFE